MTRKTDPKTKRGTTVARDPWRASAQSPVKPLSDVDAERLRRQVKATREVRFRCDNFRGFDGAPTGGDQDIQFGPLTVILGPNGAGKSTLLDAIALLARSTQGAERFDNLFARWDGYEACVHRHDRARSMRFGIERGPLAYHFELTDRGMVAVTDEKLTLGGAELLGWEADDRGWVWDFVEGARRNWGAGNNTMTLLASARHPRDRHPDLGALADSLARTALLRLAAPALRKSGKGPLSALAEDGTGLASFALHLRQEHPAVWQDVSDLVATIAPGIQGIEPYVGTDSLVTLRGRANGWQAPIPVSLLSDGTLLFLALVAVCYDPAPPPILMVEDPDHGVHPRARESIMRALREASKRSTVIVTTHDASLLTHVRTLDEVRLVEQREGSTRIVRAADHEEAREFIDDHGLAEAYASGLLGAVP